MSVKPQSLQVEVLPMSAIHPAPWNVRTGHDVPGIAESIRVNGFRDPIEVWRKTGEIVCGEGRYHGAALLGMERVPVILHDFDSIADAKRYAIANNRLTDKSEWDLPSLEADLLALAELSNLAGTGFDELAMEGLFGDHLENWETDIDPGTGGPEVKKFIVTCTPEMAPDVRSALNALAVEYPGVEVG